MYPEGQKGAAKRAESPEDRLVLNSEKIQNNKCAAGKGVFTLKIILSLNCFLRGKSESRKRTKSPEDQLVLYSENQKVLADC